MLLLTYWMMTLCCCIYAAAKGGVAGRVGAGIVLFKTVAIAIVTYVERDWQITSYSLLQVDAVCLVAFLWLSLRSDHYWPLWSTACQFLAVAIHVTTLVQPELTPKVYQGLHSLWAIPMQLFMLRGIALDRRARRIIRAMVAT
jgi:cytochrome bd-type quinol oxidase subunit 2